MQQFLERYEVAETLGVGGEHLAHICLGRSGALT